jgi:hypothetical protein
MWILRRLAEKGVSHEHLILTFISRIRVHVEINVPLWTFSITKVIIKKIENVQRIAVFIILGKEAHNDYICNLAMLNLEPLESRRDQICKHFASKILKHPVHHKMFQVASQTKTRSQRVVIVPHTRTRRYECSAIPSLAKLINSLN